VSTLSREVPHLLWSIRKKLVGLKAFVAEREQTIAPKLKDAYALLPCPTCYQATLRVDDGVACLFCGYSASSDDAADAYAAYVVGTNRFRHEKDGGVWPVLFCPSCDWDTCVNADDEGHLCFGCGERWEAGELDRCGRCDRLMQRGDGVCGHCMDEYISRDD
jgi:hypothetical protein